MNSGLAFLHTARSNVELFARLAERLDPSVPTRHALIENVLADAVGTGAVTDAMRDETEAAIRGLAQDGATIVVCTCSTIGGVAEATRVDGVRVMRIDRPMAEQAVASGRRIIVAATLPSTLLPTTSLIRQVARDANRAIEMVEWLCEDAWPHFERGDVSGYADAIARSVANIARPLDIVVLAQASMAPAEQPLAASGILALSSPELGVRAALTACREQSA
ncbi:MAG: hypothetical protein ABI634_20655 [Acidobacteriota bacterium]